MSQFDKCTASQWGQQQQQQQHHHHHQLRQKNCCQFLLHGAFHCILPMAAEVTGSRPDGLHQNNVIMITIPKKVVKHQFDGCTSESTAGGSRHHFRHNLESCCRITRSLPKNAKQKKHDSKSAVASNNQPLGMNHLSAVQSSSVAHFKSAAMQLSWHLSTRAPLAHCFLLMPGEVCL